MVDHGSHFKIFVGKTATAIREKKNYEGFGLQVKP
jgi:hypothetical protein